MADWFKKFAEGMASPAFIFMMLGFLISWLIFGVNLIRDVETVQKRQDELKFELASRVSARDKQLELMQAKDEQILRLIQDSSERNTRSIATLEEAVRHLQQTVARLLDRRAEFPNGKDDHRDLGVIR